MLTIRSFCWEKFLKNFVGKAFNLVPRVFSASREREDPGSISTVCVPMHKKSCPQNPQEPTTPWEKRKSWIYLKSNYLHKFQVNDFSDQIQNEAAIKTANPLPEVWQMSTKHFKTSLHPPPYMS